MKTSKNWSKQPFVRKLYSLKFYYMKKKKKQSKVFFYIFSKKKMFFYKLRKLNYFFIFLVSRIDIILTTSYKHYKLPTEARAS